MAELIVTIPDGSPELEELMWMVAKAQLTNPGITPSEYVSNIVMGQAQSRIINIYKGHVAELTMLEMIDKLGPLNSVRS